MTVGTRPFDPSRYLDSDNAIASFLEDAFEAGDAAFIAHAFGVVAKARGMTQIARDTGLSRESLYRSLGEDGNPELATVLKVAKALGPKLAVEVAAP